MIQREREAEGDEYVDKEAFVTGAYKAQQAELARTEEEEAKREGECARARDDRREGGGRERSELTIVVFEWNRCTDAQGGNEDRVKGWDRSTRTC